ncbi:MAG: YdcF family protein [Coriobacteriia bacterium]|nr:YdcF family protein [Coriobacteriia bacterium]
MAAKHESTGKGKKALKLVKLIVIIIGVLLLIDALINAVVANFQAGLIVLLGVSIALIIYGVIWYKKRIPKLIHAAVIVASLVVVSFSGFLAIYGNNDNVTYDEDVVIVLGAGIRGEQVTKTLAHRLDKAIEYYARNPKAIIVVSGGQGLQESISEALAMERYLIARGIPADKIIKEDQSTSTQENFLFSDAILMKKFPKGYSAVLITNDFHVYRAEKTAEYAGVSARHMGATVDWYTIPVNYLREMAAVVKLWVLPPEATAN